MLRYLFGIAVLVSIIGCQAVLPNKDLPARIVASSQASRAALQQAVNTEVGATVTLTESVFATTSILTVENRPPQTISNPNPAGRIMEAPPQFQLVKNGNDCILVDQRDQSRKLLSNTSCEPE